MDLVVGPLFLLVVAFQMLINIYFFTLQDYIDSIVSITGYGIKFFCSLPSALILGPFFCTAVLYIRRLQYQDFNSQLRTLLLLSREQRSESSPE